MYIFFIINCLTKGKLPLGWKLSQSYKNPSMKVYMMSIVYMADNLPKWWWTH